MPPGTTALSDHAHTTSGWDVIDTAPTPERSDSVGSCFLVGNGYLGYRGTRPDQRSDEFVGVVVSDTYDMADGMWRELCTVPNGLFVAFDIDGSRLRFDAGRPAEIELALDTGEVTHRWFGVTESGATALVSMRRFASLDLLGAVAQQVSVLPEGGCDGVEIGVVAGIDTDVWSLNGDHFASISTTFDRSGVSSRCITTERGTEIAVASRHDVGGLLHPAVTDHGPDESGLITRQWVGELASASAVTVVSTMAVATSNDDAIRAVSGDTVSGDTVPADTVPGDAIDGAPVAAARITADHVHTIGYRAALAASVERWREVWATADVRIEGDLAAQAALRFSIYHNRIATPAHTDRLPIGARGLSCQAYQGAAFWDQEMFNLPAFLFVDPEVARRLLVYRWRTIDGARRKARRLGYEGAFYAWISGDTGDELCPDFFFADVLTGRPIRNHFNVWQIHISPDISRAVWSYWEATGDVDFLVEHGAEIVFEVARFLRSRTLWSETRGCYELIRLLGPDEWHENVDNNAYTARLVRLALRHAAAIHEVLAERQPEPLASLLERLGVDAGELAAWARLEARLFEPLPDPVSALIEPFDGFFALEDCRPDDLRERLLDPSEYWGWPNGVAVHTQVSKQPDVVQMFAVDPSDPLAVQRANYDYFEPRCSHGSSLSHSVHATVAARLAGFDPAYLAQAYDYFMQTAALDLRNTAHAVVGGTFIGGMHTAANAGAYQTAVFGFGGFSTAGGVVTIAPSLPSAWTSLGYHVIVRGQRLAVAITPNTVTVTADAHNTAPVPVRFGDDPTSRLVEPGDHLER